ncbi:cytochrome P450 6a2-like [Athalia rosae]|uniref:cytochrome P450 6a2-like n=1 Tax=Athalia rosae TaxID=37344 RepID=UPI0020334AD6|nr:cytochrome P450 6a2-like [Athalia rosae]
MVYYLVNFLLQFIGTIIALIVCGYIYMKYVTFDYWSSRNVDFVKPIVPFGSLWPVLSRNISLGEYLRDKYLEFRKLPVFGIYTFHRPTLVAVDPEIVRFILTKEFSHFQNRGLYCNVDADHLAGNLFLLPSKKWRFLRHKFSPTFTSSKMKQMFFVVKEISEILSTFVADKAKNSELVEVKELMASFSNDVIASTAFGIQCDSLNNPDADFRARGRRIFVPRPIQNALCILVPSLANLLKIPLVDEDIKNFFTDAFKDTVKYRTENKIVRKDFLNLIMQLMNTGHLEEDDDSKKSKSSVSADTGEEDRKITILEGVAQAFVFWLAGFETSSTTAAFCLYELSLNQNIQEKVATEINEVLNKFGDLTYDSIREMPYLHKVVSETLRKYPSLPTLNRECTKDIVLPVNGLRVTKGTSVIIPVFGLHRDPDTWPDPDKFDPERFSEESIAARHQYSYLAFGEGPRNCIGKRFGLVQTKIGLIGLLSKYRFTPGPDLKIPMGINKGNFVLGPDDDITLRVEPR